MPWYDNYRGLTLTECLENIDQDGFVWFAKRLSANDTGATDTHQSGICVPKWFANRVFPSICVRNELNPRLSLSFYFPDQDHHCPDIHAIYYNNRVAVVQGVAYHGTRNEFRLTNWGRRGNTPVRDQNKTGAVVVIGVKKEVESYRALIWVCESELQESLVENWIGDEIIPGEDYGKGLFALPRSAAQERSLEALISPEWLQSFPSGKTIFDAVVAAIPFRETISDDAILMKRRKLEVSLFHAIERKHVLPKVGPGFRTVEAFMEVALQVANRRKARAGQSLELNLKQIFTDRQLRFETQAITENKKKPDFLFPSKRDYDDMQFPVCKLHMLAAKTCCKERWRQVLSEANRIGTKHLFTLQEGTTDTQLREMYDNRIVLVVPKSNIKCFPEPWRMRICSLASFVSEMKVDQ